MLGRSLLIVGMLVKPVGAMSSPMPKTFLPRQKSAWQQITWKIRQNAEAHILLTPQ